jgi:hypothetical protein
MRFRDDILRRHMEEAAIEQLTAEYQEKGYSVVPAPENGGGDADLVVMRGDERIYFHVRSTPGSLEGRDRLTRIHRHVNSQRNARLQMVLVRPPEPSAIDVENLEGQLLELCADRVGTLAVAGLGTAAKPVCVSDVEFEVVNVRRGGIEVEGTASAEFELEYPPPDACTVRDTFPLSFHLILGHDLRIVEVKSLATDVSSHV